MKTDEMADETTGNDNCVPPRRPYWPVGLALLALVIVLLGASFVLNARLRPAVGVEPAATTADARSLVPTASATVAVTGASSPEAATSAPGARTVITPESRTSGGPSDSTALEAEVKQAYLRYWDVYANAMYTLDISHLPDVAAGDRLREAIAEVDDLKAQGKAAKIVVEHHFFVFNVTENTASVHDEYVNNSYAIDPRSKNPMGTPGPGQHLVDTYDLQRIDGVWKVIRGLRESP